MNGIIKDYDEYMTRQPRLQSLIRLIKMEHPSFTSPILLCLDDVNGVTYNDEFYQFAQVSEREKTVKTSLDYGFDVAIGGYNKEIFEIIKNSDFNIQSFIKYTHYDFNSKDLTTPMRSIELEVIGIEIKKEISSEIVGFEAIPRRTITNKTGVIYSVNDVPMLEAYL